jgi:Outer membrane protein beta-barrel domain
MKRYFIAVLMLIAIKSNAQKHNWEYGFQAGININSAYGTAVSKDYKSILTGFGIGGHIQYNLSNHIGITAMPQYDQNGWSYRNLTFESTSGGVFDTGDILIKRNYQNLPILATYTTGQKIKFTIGTGVFFGLLLSNHFIVKIKEPTTSSTKSNSSSAKSFNFGIAANAGIQIPLRQKLKLIIGIHDNYGLVNTNKTTPPYISTIKTNALSLITGLALPL